MWQLSYAYMYGVLLSRHENPFLATHPALEPGILSISRNHCYIFATTTAPEVEGWGEMQARSQYQWRTGTILSGGQGRHHQKTTYPIFKFLIGFWELNFENSYTKREIKYF